ncbi:glutathione S-transferase family protein [Inquilinus limosus]|uniref:Glutathione S-transferase n=1 Tax=Inquilinus limosus MP06 TaxID=1398085 RepID=A0A0A0D8H7_9PROT|nr:glutathione S-transferase [Inquilinus limosus]KGM34449.1 glutathione S-transferase [Inquilinus limosus MP06]
MLTIWGRRNAFNVQKVLWLMGELGLPHEHIPAGGDFGGLDDPAFRAMNPHGRVPVIDEDGTVVWESHAILRYLAARDGRLWPADPAERSLADRWMDWSLATLQRDFMDLFWGHWRTPEAERNAELIARKQAACAAHFKLLDAHLAGRPYLAGDAFGLGDIPAGTVLYRYFGMGLETPPVPHVRAWYARLMERPAYREHVMMPFDDMYGRLAY